jgi:hypothetical protein
VTLTLPDAPDPTTAVMLVAELTVNDVAATPPKLTAVAPVKLVPVIVIEVLMPPLMGLKEIIVGGGGTNVNSALVAIPAGVVILTAPDAPFPTTAVMVVGFTTTKDEAGIPPKLTAVAPVKLVPVIVTIVAVVPLAGVKDVIKTPFIWFRRNETVPLSELAVAISGLPSESKSPTATALGPVPVANSILGEKEIDPSVLALSKIDMLEL